MKIGIDLGGSHIAIGLIDEGKIIKKYEHDFSSEEKENLKPIVRNQIQLGLRDIIKTMGEEDIEMIGISAPGRHKNGEIQKATNLKIDGINFEETVKEIINKKVYLKNDGMCAGIAEKKYGALKDCRNGVFLGFGTGVGTAVFVQGKLMEEIRGAGHMIIQKNGRECTCGKQGCYETYASMKVLKTQIRERFGNESLSSKEILDLLQDEKNLKQTEDIIQDYIEYMAIGIANFAKICSAEVVAIGGSFVYFKDILYSRLLKQLDKIIPKDEREHLQIKLATLGNDAGMIGATNLEDYT